MLFLSSLRWEAVSSAALLADQRVIRSESIPGVIPVGANSPQKCLYGLYAEKLSGTAFTAPRRDNLQTWLYRILPSATHGRFTPYGSGAPVLTDDPKEEHSRSNDGWHYLPDQLRWDPFDLTEEFDWIRGMKLAAGTGAPAMKSGIGIVIYSASKDMPDRTAFYSADGDLLIVPQHGSLDIQTEFGYLLVRPNEVAVYQGHSTLPELGPIESNGLANERDFQVPKAHYQQDTASVWQIVSKFNGSLFSAEQRHTPFDVVAWHGRYYWYKYDLGRFNTIGSISFNHPDPSIFTVLTAPTPTPGTAVADFVIFPPRWLVQEDTLRPPWYHRNTMSVFMGLIAGEYDAKEPGAFRPGGASLHNTMSGQGPDAAAFEQASNCEIGPVKVGEGSMAFIFESCLMMGVTEWRLKSCWKIQEDYNVHSWVPLQVHFRDPGLNAAGKEDIINGT
ncbi:RmlC-like cupin domain-containing protein [Phialemonium atrogriseum]|uniref:homogentisate 1,2-dioxygenase n=1 Tax=Phialemonium atrogriseum TaxID=1093897 RepID=A0AAJ0FEL3_9PEZI|nr:RmlC-like cupin domain-containing protein [Phialemonium atrogriseum]KAK1764487.1 RmlC-like cupin domain-containing protein [Phialemonium atrogriseum]